MTTAERNLVGRCGLYCGACVIYRAYKDDGKYLSDFAEKRGCPAEKVRCEGCQALTSECWGAGCKIVQCLDAKSLSFCYECPQYGEKSCENLEKLAKRYLDIGVDVRASLSRIKSGQTAAWLKENMERFRCPACKKSLPAGAKKCYHCGKELAKLL